VLNHIRVFVTLSFVTQPILRFVTGRHQKQSEESWIDKAEGFIVTGSDDKTTKV